METSALKYAIVDVVNNFFKSLSEEEKKEHVDKFFKIISEINEVIDNNFKSQSNPMASENHQENDDDQFELA